MFFLKFILVIIFFLLPTTSTFGKDIIFNKKVEGTQTVEFAPRSSGHYKITNVVLQKISEANNKLRAFTRYDINYVLEFSITEIDRHYLKVNLTDINLTGDIYYKDFKIADNLKPTKIKMALMVSSNTNDSFLIEFNIPVSNITGSNSHNVFVDINSKNDVDISLENVLFYYDKKFLDDFKKWENVLYTYYDSNNTIKRINEIIKGFSIDNPDRIIMDEFSLCDAERMYWQIYFSPFINTLNLEQTDPIDFKNRYKSLNDSLKYFRKVYNEKFSRLYNVYYKQGLDYYNEGSYKFALNSFEKATTFNSAHIPSYLAKAKTYIAVEQIDSAAEVLAFVSNDLYPHNEVLDSTKAVIDKVFENYFYIIDGFNENDKYTEAISIIEKADYYNEKISLADFNYDINKRYTIAHTGIYDSFLEVINRAVTKENISYANIYINHTLKYQQKHHKFIEDHNRIFYHLQNLVDRLTVEGHEKHESEEYLIAKTYFNNAFELCKEYSEINCDSNISQYIALAEDAIEVFLAEKEIREEEIAEKKYSKEDIFRQKRNSIIDFLSQGHLKAWAGEIDDAKEIYINVKADVEKYRFQNDSLINERLASLSERISRRECELANRDFQRLLDEYSNLSNNKLFSRAKKKLTEAEELYKEKSNCDLDIEIIRHEKKKISPAAEYLEMISEARSAFLLHNQNNHEDFMNKYFQTDIFYDENDIEDFGLSHNYLYQFLISNSEIEFIMHGVTFYSDNKEPELALKLLLALKEKEVSRRNVSNIQKYAGKKAAQHYIANYDDLSLQQMFSKTKREGMWLNPYNRALRKEWLSSRIRN